MSKEREDCVFIMKESFKVKKPHKHVSVNRPYILQQCLCAHTFAYTHTYLLYSTHYIVIYIL